MRVMFEATVTMEYELRSDQTMEELLEDVLDQIRCGEYFPSRVKDVSVSDVKKSA